MTKATWTPVGVLAPFLMEKSVETMLNVFTEAGHANDVRFVGGCVRNILMNLPVSDIDIATSLVPERVREIFEARGFNVHDTGIEHGTVTVVVCGEPFEITTLRKDVETDGRRAVIEYTTDWAEDAQRRDFRCNAIYMNGMGRLYDPTNGGIRDAIDRKLVFVGDADLRIREDYLRILRLFRFMATLGATAEDDALEACARHVTGIRTLSGERIEKEMMKLMSSKNPVPSIQHMIEHGVIEEVFFGVPDTVTLRRVVEATTDPAVRLAAALTTTDAKRVLKHWNSSNDLTRRIASALDGSVSMERGDLKAMAYEIGFEALSDRMILTWAEECDPDMTVDELRDLIKEVGNDIPSFPVRGQDVVDSGVAPGPEVGRVLKAVESWWKNSGYPEKDVCVRKIQELT